VRYEPPGSLATKLGNTEPGDGKRFKGRGPIQITGRANYRRFGGLLHVDLVSDPARAADPDLAFRIAGLFWSKNGLNELADRATLEAFREITRRINGGINGLTERQKFYSVACSVLGVAAPARSRGRPPEVAVAADEPTFERGFEQILRDRGERGRVRHASGRKKKTSSGTPSRRASRRRAATSRAKRRTSRRASAVRKKK
jgi:hypothetical protein